MKAKPIFNPDFIAVMDDATMVYVKDLIKERDDLKVELDNTKLDIESWKKSFAFAKEEHAHAKSIYEELSLYNKRLEAEIAQRIEAYSIAHDQAMSNGAELDKHKEALRVAREAMEMGAFHHDACPYYDTLDCSCAHKKVDEALTKIDEVLK